MSEPFYTSPDVTLWKGDCLTEMARIADGSVDAVITDPPYGMDYQSARRIDKSKRFKKIANDKRPFIWWIHSAAAKLKEGGCVVCFCRWDSAEAFKMALEWGGLNIVSQIVWDRMHHGMGDLKGAPAPMHDTIWLASKGRFLLHGKRPKSVVRHQRIGGDDLTHPNEKPLSLMEELVSDYCPPNGIVLDCFGGSGVTADAARNTNRRAIIIEREQDYCEIIAKRLAPKLDKAA